jgi:hypothetical protein
MAALTWLLPSLPQFCVAQKGNYVVFGTFLEGKLRPCPGPFLPGKFDGTFYDAPAISGTLSTKHNPARQQNHVLK